MPAEKISIPADVKKLKALIDRRHPVYAEKMEHWSFLLETYLGSRDWFADNIFRFNREGDDTYRGRIDRAYRFNHTREVVDLVNKYLFKQAPIRKVGSNALLDKFRTRATMSGLDLHEFERQVGRSASIFGRCYVVVDNTFKPGEAETVADLKTASGQLYAYIVAPMQFLDCGYDSFGQYEWVLLHENHRDDDDPFTSTGEVQDRYRLWTKHSWALFGLNSRGRAELIDSGDHDLGVVPVLKCDHIESDEKYAVPALIEDIAYLDRAIANYLSNLDQIINDQTFSQLVMPAQGILGGTAAGNPSDPDDPDTVKNQRRIQKLGTSQILVYDGEHGDAPAYISPDPRQANLILSVITKIINEIYHTVGLAGERTKEDNSMGIDNSSGVAKAFDFERVNALLSAKANSMQSFSNRLETLVCIYGGENLTFDNRGEDTVRYAMNFDVRGLLQDMAISQELSLLNAPIEIKRAQMKVVLNKLWPLMKDEDREKLEKAIDTWEDSLDNSLTADLVAPSSVNDGKPGQGAVGGKEAVAKVADK